MDLNAENPIVVEDFPAFRPSLRIAVVTETWPPEVNGVAVTLAKLVQGLCRRNHDVQLVRPKQVKNEIPLHNLGFEEVLMRGMPIPRYPELKLGLPSKKNLVKAWTLRRPDVVHIATEGPLGWSAMQAAKVLKLPVTSDFRTNFHSYSQHYGVGWLRKPIVAYLRKFHNATACTMVPTQALKNELAQHGFLNLKVVARGVDTVLFNPLRRSPELRSQWNADSETVVLISVGRLALEKNLGQVMACYESLKSAGAKVKLVLVGDGPMRETICQRCPDAIFAGMLSHDALATYYASADLFLFPSLTETFGNVTVEALASGLPVLAFNCAAATDWVKQGVNGWLVSESEPEAYVSTALKVAMNPELLSQVAGTTRSQVSQLDWDQISEQVEAVFEKAIHSFDQPTSRLRQLLGKIKS
ncbi:MAG: glycosyltransferase family 1 protein [Betaproteobacteria bacterium]|jgi:glycosyltransferase involved in cell wall biosynthesis